jgi:uncharacterized protein (DUF608 family)
MSACCGPGQGCGPTRRDVLRSTGAGAGAWLARPFAGPFSRDDFPVPADKRLDPAWVRALFERGEPTVYRKTRGELAHIGMPIGGLACGQLYLGGDGRLWLWDLFNLPPAEDSKSGRGPHYAAPLAPRSPLGQGFALRVTQGERQSARRLDASSFAEIEFRGQYPLAFVRYVDPELPLEIELEAFSPFVPLRPDESSLPCTFLRYALRNGGAEPIEVEIGGWLENGLLPSVTAPGEVERVCQVTEGEGPAAILHGAREIQPALRDPPRPAIVLADFERPDYAGWATTGSAFGAGPLECTHLPAYQGDVDAQGTRLVNSHNVRQGEDVAGGDRHTGTLTSPRFAIERDYLSLRLGGGNHPGRTGVELLIGDSVVRSATGLDENRMRFVDLDVREFSGAQAALRIVDREEGGWGNVGVDDVVLTDLPRAERLALAERGDHGTLALCVLAEAERGGAATAGLSAPIEPDAFFDSFADPVPRSASDAARPIGGVRCRLTLAPGESAEVAFVLAWHLSGLWWGGLGFLPDVRARRRHYHARFPNALAVLEHALAHARDLSRATELWHATWYDSTLPHWFLERTFANLSTLATATCTWLDDGRFHGWEGTYCCPGTCAHVWQYAQGLARVFPTIERDLRERVDFGLAFHDDSGAIDVRAEAQREVAIDGQCGTILRAWREHLTAPDDAFLRRIWPRVKKAVEHLIGRDADQDGVLEGAQFNTLDATWYGEIPWITSLYLAALRAGEAMAIEMGDAGFAERCRALRQSGSTRMLADLFDGEYFVQRPDPAHPEANSTGAGCHIDQVLGQAWAHQVGLGRILPRKETRSALRSLWKYSFAPDVGPYRERFDAILRGGRWYAMPGEAGLLMCTWPRGGSESATGSGGEAWAAGYFNECMTGFEHQVAAHMLWEGLALEGLAITRAIHDRYHAARRNPWNEVECGDHYARALASYGTFLAACGFELHGPKRHLGFAPRLGPERFAAAFTAAEGWGTIQQERRDGGQRQAIELRLGKLALASLAFEVALSAVSSVEVSLRSRDGERAIPANFRQAERRVEVLLVEPVELAPGQVLVVEMR